MIKIEQVVEFKTNHPCFDIEDGGRAVIANPVVIEGEDEHFFLRFQSWNEAAWHDLKDGPRSKHVPVDHPLIASMWGKKFKITIEEIV